MSLSIATWNVNSVRSRLPHLLSFLRDSKPDIALLQELKCTGDAFPAMEVEELGYNTAIFGEKTYNGVAILSKFPLDDVRKGLPGDEADTQARYIEAVASLPPSHPSSSKGEGKGGGAIRVASVYVPNGQEVASDKFAYKLRFLARLEAHAMALRDFGEALVIGGDYNIAPYAVDVHDARAWENSVLFHPDVRTRLRTLLYEGFYDAFRLANPQAVEYSWWDYRANALAANDGLRIDHLLLSPQAADRLTTCTVEKGLRLLEKPSDHAPVVASLSLP